MASECSTVDLDQLQVPDEPDEHDDDEIREQLIASIKSRKVIYDASSTSKRNKFLNDLAWTEVAKEVKQIDSWCKLEWTRLRDAYRRKKKTAAGKSGQARKKVEAWPHFLSMPFMDDFLVSGPTSGNMESSDQTEKVVSDDEQSKTGSTTANGGSDDKAGERAVKNDSRKRSRSDDLSPVDAEIVKFLKRPTAISTDEHYHFCVGLAERMRKMDIVNAGFVNMKIMELMYQTESKIHKATE